ncbi:MAG: oligosaccharide flippase family protein [Leadbetterella sp.]|nr:oligosaccharide flippase family protein [Leadbetterella sp.]
MKLEIKKIFNNKLFQSSTVYLFTDLLSKSLPFILIPFLTDEFSPREYGILMNFQTLLLLLGFFTGFGSQSYVLVKYYDLEEKYKRELNGNLLILGFISVVGLSFIGFFLRSLVFNFFEIDSKVLCLVLFCLFFDYLINLSINLNIIGQKPLNVSKIRITKLILELSTTLLFVFQFNLGFSGRIYSILAATVIVGTYLLYGLLKTENIIFTFTKKSVQPILNFGLPLIPHELSSWIKAGYDKVFVTATFGIALSGVYSLSFQIASAMLITIISFNNAYVPFLFKKLSTSHCKESIVLSVFRYFGLVLIIFFLMFLICPFIFKYLVSEQFEKGLEYVNYILIGMLFKGFYYAVVSLLIFQKKTKVLAIITFCSSIFYLITSYILSKYFDIYGVFFAYICSEIFAFVLVWYYANTFMPLPWLPTLRSKLNFIKL